MVKLDKIYTRGGDQGETSLTDGNRVKKHHLRVESYGVVDEANSALGIAICYSNGKVKKFLLEIQNDLFDLGADLSTPSSKEEALRISEKHIKNLENAIDQMNERLLPLQSFVLPGGSKFSAFIHLTRTIIRRAERITVALSEQEEINPLVMQYLNRLSDYMFVLSRYANKKGKKDILWRPGKNID